MSENIENPNKFEPIRWAIHHAASEFGLDRKTLSKRLRLCGFMPGDDGLFTTFQIHRAASEYEFERTRKMKEEADAVGFENEQRRGNLADLGRLSNRLEGPAVGIKQVIMNSGLTDDEKDTILNHICDLLAAAKPGTKGAK